MYRLANRLFVYGALLGASVTFSHAQSSVLRWAMDGAGCVPVDSATQQDLYTIVGGHIKFKGDKTGTVTLVCPVSVGVGTVNFIGVSYRDSTGLGADAHVKAVLRRLRKADGSPGDVSLAFDSNKDASNNPPATIYTFQRQGGTDRSHTLDDENYYYFVQVSLLRNAKEQVIQFGGVQLDNVPN